MMNKMVVANLVQRPVRSLISVSAVAFGSYFDSAHRFVFLRATQRIESQPGRLWAPM